MSIQIIPQPGSFGTQIGAGFGKGLAESLPEGVKQGRLSATLKNLEGQKLSPLEQVSRLVGQGGISAQEAGQLLPYIQQSQARQQFLGNEGETSGMSGAAPTPEATQPQATQAAPQITSPQSLARKLWSANPTMFNSINEAETYATNKINNADAEFNRLKDTFLQKSGNESYKDIVGELEEDYRNRLKSSINLRGDEVAEANRIGKEMLDFAKTRGDLRTNLDKNFLTLPHEKMIRSLNKLREDYAKRGQLHNFANDLIAGGMSGNFARTFAQPVDGDPELKKYLNSIPKERTKTKNFVAEKTIGPSSKQSEKVFEGALNRISPKVSLSSVALDLMTKGYDPEAFFNYAEAHQENLSKYQLEELGKTDPWNPNLDDIFILEGKKGAPAWWQRFSTFMKG
jgi:hypothetical protein